jgi:hypothetical protein
VQSQISSLEEDQPVQEEHVVPTEVKTSPVPDSVKKQDIEIQSVPASSITLEDMLSNDAQEPELTKKNTWVYWFGSFFTGVILLLSVCIYLVYLQSSKMPVATTSPSTTPTPIPTITVDPKTLTIEVFNASGVAGKAAKTADELKSKGYTIVSTGNAKKIPSTTVSFSNSISARAKELILSDLQAMGLSSISSVLVDSSVSARVTLGLK